MTKINSNISPVLFALVFACGAAESGETFSATTEEPAEQPAAPETSHEAPEGSPSLMVTHVETHPSQGPQRNIAGGEARLAVTSEGAMATITTGELTPGHVYTLWFVAINKPENCASSPCKGSDVIGNNATVDADVRWADGGVAGKDGTLRLTTWAPAGEWTGGWFGNGYKDLKRAEIHVVVNDHGPVIPGRESEMLSTYRGGCTDESLPPPFPESAKSDGTAGPNTCALVQDAIFRM